MAAETSQTLDRGLRLVETLAASPEALTIAELAVRLDLNRTVVYRLVATLEDHAVVRRRVDGRVGLGLGLMRLGQAVRPGMRALVAPVLRALADRVGATAHFTVAEGDEAVAIAVVEPTWTDVHVAYRVGARHRVTDGAAGKAILLGRDGAAPGAYVTSEGELQPGARGVAAPVPAVDGVDASVGLVSLHDLDAGEVGPQVAAAARAVARALAV